jgi:hypothetical protein
MATGDRNINLLTGATSSGAPTLTDGALGVALPFSCDQAVICVRSTAGTGDLTVDLTLWGYVTELARWYSLGSLTTDPLAEDATDAIAHAVGIAGLRAFTRMYCEIAALGGTSTAVTVDAICIRSAPVTTS